MMPVLPTHCRIYLSPLERNLRLIFAAEFRRNHPSLNFHRFSAFSCPFSASPLALALVDPPEAESQGIFSNGGLNTEFQGLPDTENHVQDCLPFSSDSGQVLPEGKTVRCPHCGHWADEFDIDIPYDGQCFHPVLPDPVSNVSAGQDRCSDNGCILDPDSVMYLVPFL